MGHNAAMATTVPHLTIRDEAPSDIDAVHDVEELAFGRAFEADAVDALQRNRKTVLSLVAEVEGAIVGHILFARTTIETGTSTVIEASLGPIAVLPDRQHQGIGSAMILAGVARCRELGFGSVFLLGNPAYYGRFGFRPASEHGIAYHQALSRPDAFQVLELHEGALRGVAGIAHEEPELG